MTIMTYYIRPSCFRKFPIRNYTNISDSKPGNAYFGHFKLPDIKNEPMVTYYGVTEFKQSPSIISIHLSWK